MLVAGEVLGLVGLLALVVRAWVWGLEAFVIAAATVHAAEKTAREIVTADVRATLVGEGELTPASSVNRRSKGAK